MTMPRRILMAPRFVLATILAGALILLIGVGQAAPASAADAAVGINGFAFTPATLTVPVGTRVVWTNMQANVPHTVTSDTPGIFDSGNLPTGQTFAFTFNQAGSFAYHCNIHPTMHGMIVVQVASGATTAPAATAPAAATQPVGTTAPAATVPRPAATGVGGAAVVPSPPAAPTATRPAATAVPASMPRAGGGGLAKTYVDGDSGSVHRGLWFGILGAFAVVAVGGWYALRLRRR